MPSSRRPTSMDVARAAGVSQATVSLVLNGLASGRVSPATQLRVERAAESLGYRANAAARSLRLGRAMTLALVVPDVRNPFFASVLRGASHVARRAGYTVVLLDVANRRNWQVRARSALAAGALDGLVVCSVEPPGPRALADLGARVVAVDTDAPHVPSVQLDIAGGTQAAARHLLGLGHRRIGHLASQVRHATFRTRAAALQDALRAAGLSLEPALVRRAALDPETARPVARALLDQAQPPTAIFCDDDLLAAAVYKAAHDLGLVIPRDLSVIGFDDIPLARLLEPELTTVAVPAQRLGQQGVRHLLAVLNGQPVAAVTRLGVRLVVRGSTDAPRPA